MVLSRVRLQSTSKLPASGFAQPLLVQRIRVGFAQAAGLCASGWCASVCVQELQRLSRVGVGAWIRSRCSSGQRGCRRMQ